MTLVAQPLVITSTICLYDARVDSFQTGSGQTGSSQRCRNFPQPTLMATSMVVVAICMVVVATRMVFAATCVYLNTLLQHEWYLRHLCNERSVRPDPVWKPVNPYRHNIHHIRNQ